MGATNRLVERGKQSPAHLQSFQKRDDPARSHIRPCLARFAFVQTSIRGAGASAMGLHIVSDDALAGGRLRVGDAGGWLNSCVLRAELIFYLGCDLAVSMRDSIRRHRLRCHASRIQVSALSDTWLRIHETEYDKHRAEP